MASLETAPAARVGFATFALAAALLVSMPLVLGFFAHIHPAFDAMAHLRAHLAVLMAAIALGLLFAKQRLHGVVGLILALGAFATTLPTSTFKGAGSPGARPGDRAVYRLLQLNLRHDHPDPGRVLSLIARERPDVLTLNEVSAPWRARLDAIASAYPYNLVCGRRDPAGGVAILSRRPLSETAGDGCAADGRHAAATVNFGGRAVQVQAVHLERPWPFGQARHLETILPLMARREDASIVGIDLNATPWSAAYARLAATTGLSPAPRAGPTWLHHALPPALRPWIGFPIDHVFSGPDLTVHAARALEDAGSDHLPVLAEFSVRPLPVEAPVAVADAAR